MEETFNAATGRPVVATDSAEDLGEVKTFIVDEKAKRIEAIHVAGRGRNGELVPWNKVATFGADAVMTTHADDTEQVATDREKLTVRGKIKTRESRVLTTDGFEAGRVQDVVFDSETGKLISIRTEDGDVPADHLVSLGSYALIIKPIDEDRPRHRSRYRITRPPWLLEGGTDA